MCQSLKLQAVGQGLQVGLGQGTILLQGLTHLLDWRFSPLGPACCPSAAPGTELALGNSPLFRSSYFPSGLIL